MNILLIEDEQQAAWNLQTTIQTVKPGANILGVADSLTSAKDWLTGKPAPDLIFSDIQLGDGIIFDLFKAVAISCPVIFCTAYDEYLLQAFKSNGIDYLLKPIDEAELKRSFEKLEVLQRSTLTRHQVLPDKVLPEIFRQKHAFKSSFLIPHRDKLIPVETNSICFFKVTENGAELGLSDGKTYHHNFTLDYLVTVLDPLQFCRVNRQYILSFSGIHEIEHYDDRKLLVHLKEPCKEKIVISKAKASEFLRWVQSRLLQL